MQQIPDEKEIQRQQTLVFGPEPTIRLIKPCKVNEGILRLDPEMQKSYIQLFDKQHQRVSFFIPASGSGSRMIEFLHEFINSHEKEIEGKIELFMNSLENFAFFKQLPEEFKQKIRSEEIDLDDLIRFLIEEHGLNLGNSPKGLIPFHKAGPFVLTPLQEHLIQGTSITKGEANFHFTVQKKFEHDFHKIIQSTAALTGNQYSVSFSEQSIDSNAIAFSPDGKPAKNASGEFITRPSGHGALLPILNEVNEELILIKNIDNIQHLSKSSPGTQIWKLLSGILIAFRKDALDLFENPSANELFELNEKYQLFDQTELNNLSTDSIRSLIDRPIRVCGMVKNEGQPGGGPFWIEKNGKISKQIVEKAQISSDQEQRSILLRSTHFNPVMIACCPYSLSGKKFDLMKFRDEDAFFVVNKTSDGQPIRYIEQPGLWNGSMAYWNTIFVEIPSNVFSPVKTILDLLHPLHTED